MYVYIDGDIEEAGAARLSVFEHGFMYGLGLFETFRIYNGHPFLLDDHFRRLEEGLREMNVSWVYDRQQVLEQVESLRKANAWDNAYVRYNVAAGTGMLGLTANEYTAPTIVIYMKPLPPAEEERTVVKTGRLLTIPRNTPETSKRLKSHHFLNNIAGKREAGDNPEVEGLFLNEAGKLAEGVVSNLFWVKDDTLYTPALDTGILAGVTRAFVLQAAEKHSVYIREGHFDAAHLYHADEVFVTNSIQEIVPFSAVDEHTFRNNCHSITALLQKEYAKGREKLWKAQDLFL
ncbi:aminodeoxychorismate lyase [Bacillus piscicola]|uniref:aminodeoxychorismate lyase n=1 Tax=Bacillus piscicola TaxID=1632684 RepID=UPI001F09ADB9|nr:aminodeoxychorismate lyase [Bacillus piscicola]